MIYRPKINFGKLESTLGRERKRGVGRWKLYIFTKEDLINIFQKKSLVAILFLTTPRLPGLEVIAVYAVFSPVASVHLEMDTVTIALGN